MDVFTKGFIEIMAAEQSMDDTNWFQGTADAVRRCLKHFNNPSIKYILVLSGDQLYKMDLAEMYNHHLTKGAELTVACKLVSPEDVPGLGIMGLDKDSKITKFIEKPKDVSKIRDMAVMSGGKERYPGSMGIYLFNKSALVELLARDKKADFGREIIPEAIQSKNTYAYLFDGYWRDIGTIKTFYEENLSMTDPIPPLDLFDEKWQIFTRTRYLPPAKFEDSHIERSIVAEGAILLSSKVSHSIIGLRLRVGKGTVIEDTIAMGCDYYETVEQIEENSSRGIPLLGMGENCHIRRTIIDKDVRIGDNVRILNTKGLNNFDGPDFHIRDGIVIISKNSTIPSGTVI